VSGIRAIKRTQDVVFNEKSFYNPENEESDNKDSDNEVSEVISTKA
jgi:hypothetical protein